MESKIQKQKHYGAQVWTNIAMDTLRRTECLCLLCDEMQKEGPCEIGLELYRICQQYDLALAVTRCPSWKTR